MLDAIDKLIGGTEKPDIEALKRRILAARLLPSVDREKVICACGALSRELASPEYAAMLSGLGMPEEKALREISLAREMLSEGYLRERVKTELGETEDEVFAPFGSSYTVKRGLRPLGVLLHISAGNVDALPAFSVIEGLLTGNVNLLKLPREDNGLSAAALERLCSIEPAIAPFVEVFDVPSSDTETLTALAALSDAVIVWGGDEAVAAARRLAKPDTRVIEWGHKLSFAYFSGDQDDDALYSAAENICMTEQLYCSSCQGVYLDTDDFDRVCRFAERFAAILGEVSNKYPFSGGERIRAQKTLELYTEELESRPNEKRVFRSNGVGVIAVNDSVPDASYQFRCQWVKPLKRERLPETLMHCKNRLQTVFLSCPEEEKEYLSELLLKTGAVRITDGRLMSREYCGMPHDGAYPLLLYMKRVSLEI